MEHRCECSTWQGLIQQVVYQVSRGYRYYHVTYYPDHKKDRWPAIDKKLMKKYPILSKDQRYRRKMAGAANFFIIRWQHCAVILMSPGGHGELGDRFDVIQDKPLSIKVSNIIELIIHHGATGKGITVHFSRECYRGLKAILWDAAHTGKRKLLIEEFNRLNGIPAWSGISEQKGQLLTYLLTQAKVHNIPVTRADFRFVTRRTIHRVYPDDEASEAVSMA